MPASARPCLSVVLLTAFGLLVVAVSAGTVNPADDVRQCRADLQTAAYQNQLSRRQIIVLLAALEENMARALAGRTLFSSSDQPAWGNRP